MGQMAQMMLVKKSPEEVEETGGDKRAEGEFIKQSEKQAPEQSDWELARQSLARDGKKGELLFTPQHF